MLDWKQSGDAADVAAALTPPTLLSGEGSVTLCSAFRPQVGAKPRRHKTFLHANRYYQWGKYPSHTHTHTKSHSHTHPVSDCLSFRQTRPAAERDRHAAAPQPGQADAPPRGLHPHLHCLCKLQPQAHRRGHLSAARRAPQAHRVPGVSGITHKKILSNHYNKKI